MVLYNKYIYIHLINPINSTNDTSSSQFLSKYLNKLSYSVFVNKNPDSFIAH